MISKPPEIPVVTISSAFDQDIDLQQTYISTPRLVFFVVNQNPDHLERFRPGVSREITSIVNNALEKDPGDDRSSSLHASRNPSISLKRWAPAVITDALERTLSGADVNPFLFHDHE